MRRLLQALCLSAALVMPYNPFALAEQNRKAEEARKAEPAAPHQRRLALEERGVVVDRGLALEQQQVADHVQDEETGQ